MASVTAAPAPKAAATCPNQPTCGCIKFCRAEKYGKRMRTGADYIADLKADGREIYIDGERVADVTTHPAFAGAVQSIARLHDIAADPANRELMTFTSPKTGRPVNRIWTLPRSREDLTRRREAIERWSGETLGLMGRSPDHVAGFFAGYACAPEVFARSGQRYADNVVRFYEFMRDHDVYISYTIVPPQIDRSKPAHQQNPPDLYAGVVEERDDGVVIRGAQMLGTGSVLADFVQLSTIHPMKAGDENYAISIAVPCNAPGVKLYSRRSYAQAASSVFDYPLATRFDENDSLLVYDNVFVPWERVFIYKDLDLVRAQWFEAPAHVMGNSQAQIRFTRKLHFLVGLARRIVEMNGIAGLPPVQSDIGRLATYAAMVQGLVYAAEYNATTNANGYVVPGLQEVYANMNLQSEIYPQMLNLVRELCGGGLIQLPSSVADLTSEVTRGDVTKYVQSPGVAGEERIKLLKLAWDMIGSEFAGRHEQYEKFYAGAPFIVRSHMWRVYDFARAGALVDHALSGYDINGRK